MRNLLKKTVFPCILTFGLLLSGCGSHESTSETPMKLKISNLADGESREKVSSAALASGILQENLDLFFSDVLEYNQIIENTDLVPSGFTAFDGKRPDYNRDRISGLWSQKYPLFLGYNCRMTAYTLLKSGISVENTSFAEKTELDMVLGNDQTKEFVQSHFTEEEIKTFGSLFVTLESGGKAEDSATYAGRIRQAWQERGINFSEAMTAKLICVYTEGNFLDKGEVIHAEHAGILLPAPEGGWYFIEKISFQLPYQVIHFTDKNGLHDYLTGIYATKDNKCFIMENDSLLTKS